MATCTQCGAELKPGTKFCENCGAKVSVPQPAAQPAAVPQPRFSLPRLRRNPHSLYRRPRSPRRTQRILTQAMRPAHRRRPAQAHRFTPETHRRMLPMLSRRRHPAARAATLTAMWPPAARLSAPAHR